MRRPTWMRAPRWLPRWLIDPPHMLRLTIAAALSVAVAVLATLAVVSTVTSFQAAQSALNTRDDTAARASARISLLSEQIAALNGRAETNSSRIGELIAEVHALEEQVRQMGGSPVASEPRSTPTVTTIPENPPASAPQRPSPAPEPSTTTTTTAPPTPSTTAPCTTLPVVGCINGRASRSAARTELDWEALRQCESGGDYSTNTGNGYFGAYQFSPGTWQGLGYEGLPSDALPSTQDEAAQRLYMARGASPWPVCGARL